MGVTVNHWLEEFDPLTRSHHKEEYEKNNLISNSIDLFEC